MIILMNVWRARRNYVITSAGDDYLVLSYVVVSK